MSHRLALQYVEIDIPSFDQPDSPPNSPLDSPPQAITTYRFAKDTKYLPSNIDAIPSIINIDVSPAIISLGENLGQRATLTATFRDHKHIFTTEDFDSGTFWGKFRARYGLKLQGRNLRLIQGFVGQEIGSMETRTFTIESTDGPSTKGVFKIIAKDLFKFADGERAQAPTPSSGFLVSDILAAAGSFTLSPSGIGNEEYPASGLLNIGGNEVVSFTRVNDAVTITRAQYNTTAQDHEAGSRAQVCLEFLAQDVAQIVNDLMVDFAAVDQSLIPVSTWLAETGEFLNTVYSALITEPTAVNKLISELVEQAGLAVWWDDLENSFRLQVLRAISTASDTFDADVIMADTLEVTEQPSKRLSQVYVYFDKINPLVNDDQINNYRSSTFDRDLEAEAEYGAVSVKKVFSRWIPTAARSVADTLISILLSRFRDPPRRIRFELFRDEIGNYPTLGGGYQLEAWPFQDASGAAAAVPVQLTSINPLPDRFEIEAEEMLFTAFSAGASPDNHVIFFDGSLNNVNLRSVHDSIYSTPTSGLTINCTVAENVIIGSTSTATPAFHVGDWPAGITINIIVLGRIQGKGGDGGAGGTAVFAGGSGGASGGVGGTALYTREAINLSGAGQIWGGGGGGGGGGGRTDGGSEADGGGGGGGGAGTNAGGGGVGGFGSTRTGGTGNTGTSEAGGTPVAVTGCLPGGTGGAPGASGTSGTSESGAGGFFGGAGGSGAASGKAIDGSASGPVTGSVASTLGGTIN